ncbi:MAG: hypothetical protein JWR80_9487 [Bradyrhizobium sp.]|nr:hypothetical protein [Bradyrhizobium sp.]
MAWGICTRCGWQYDLKKLRKEWTGLRVCTKCFDPKPPNLTPPKVKPEGKPLPNAAPEPEPYFVTDNEVTPDDL